MLRAHIGQAREILERDGFAVVLVEMAQRRAQLIDAGGKARLGVAPALPLMAAHQVDQQAVSGGLNGELIADGLLLAFV